MLTPELSHRDCRSGVVGASRHDYRFRTIRSSLAEGGPVSASSSSGNDSHEPMLDCVIVGVGIGALCTAQALATKHRTSNFMVTEANERVGGNIITVERDGYLWEEGPNSFQPSNPMLTLAVDSGLKDDFVFGDLDAPRFVLWDDKLRPVPSKIYFNLIILFTYICYLLQLQYMYML